MTQSLSYRDAGVDIDAGDQLVENIKPFAKRTTQFDFARAAAQRLRRPLLFSVPEQALRLMLGEQADLVLDGQFAPPKALLQQGFEFTFPTIECALDNLLG